MIWTVVIIKLQGVVRAKIRVVDVFVGIFRIETNLLQILILVRFVYLYIQIFLTRHIINI